MRLVSFAELCEMPEGTIFQEYTPHYLGGLCIFGGAIRNTDGPPRDFLVAELLPQCAVGSYWSSSKDKPKLEGGSEVDDNGLYIVTPDGYGRWAKFEYDRKFLVWDAEDRRRLATWLFDPMGASQAMNDDEPHAIIDADK